MLSEEAKTWLAAFFLELKEHQTTFADCSDVGVNTRGFMGETPLKFAVVRQDEVSVRYLLSAGANPNLQGEDDCTPLHHAAGGESEEIVRLLLAHGASTKILDRYGNTPVQYVTDNTEILAILTKHTA